MAPTLSPVPGRWRAPVYKLSRLCKKSYFNAYLAPEVTKWLTIYNNLLKSGVTHSSATQHELLQAKTGISHLDGKCVEKLTFDLLHMSILVNDWEITNGLIHILGNINRNLLEFAYNMKCEHEIIMQLISAGQDVNFVLPHNTYFTPLNRSCLWNDFDMVEQLLRHGARIVPDVIAFAAECSDVNIMRLLMSKLTDTQRAVMLTPVQRYLEITDPLTMAMTDSNWECLDVLVQSVPRSWFNDRKPFTEFAKNIISRTIASYEQTKVVNLLGLGFNHIDHTDFNLEKVDYEIYNGQYGKNSLLLLAIQYSNKLIVEFIVRNYLHQLDQISLQTALHAAVVNFCAPDILNALLEHLPHDDNHDVQAIQHLYWSTGLLRIEHGFTALHVAADLGIISHFRALLHRYGAEALFEDNHGTIISPLSLAVKHPCLWPIFTQTSIYMELVRRGVNLTRLAHRYHMFPSTDTLCVPSIEFSESQQTWVNIEQAQVHVTEHFSQLLKRYQITPVWDTKTGETNQITTIVIEHLNQVSSLMKKNFPFLEFDVLLSGSSDENTKAIAPDELDFILPLTFFSKCISVQNTSTDIPYVSVEPNTSLRDMLKKHKLLNEQGIIEMIRVLELFRAEFTKCIALVKSPREMCIYNNIIVDDTLFSNYSPFMLKLQWLGEIYLNLKITVDIVPAFVIIDTNKQSIAEHVKAKIRSLNLTNSNVYAVLKSNLSYENQLRLSFSEHEAALIKRASEAARKGYTLAKCLRDSRICPKVQQPYSSEYMEAEQSVSTYVLKTCFMSLLRERHIAASKAKSTSKSTGQSENIISTRSITWAKMIYAKLEENLTRYGRVPHIFYEDWDVYYGKVKVGADRLPPRAQMFADRKMSVTLLHCEIITNMLNTLHSDINFSYTEDNKEITLHYIQPRPIDSILSMCPSGKAGNRFITIACLFILISLFIFFKYMDL